MSSNTKSDDTKNEVEPKKIKHLVISGGGALGLSFYGALKESNLRGIWKQEDIETIYATSIGTVISVSISLGYSWEILDDFFIKRPWHHVFKVDLGRLMNAIQQQGMYSSSIAKDVFLPLFKGKNISPDITLAEFYHLTKRDIHFIATEYNRFCVEDISYKTHPEWKVLDAIYASCCLPFVFSPFYAGNKIYMDGGIMMHYPLNLSIAAGNDPREILGIRRLTSKNEVETQIQPTHNLFEVLFNIILKLMDKAHEPLSTTEIGYNIEITKNDYNIYTFLYSGIYSDETRKELIEIGKSAVRP